jgi:hypothetical protein
MKRVTAVVSSIAVSLLIATALSATASQQRPMRLGSRDGSTPRRSEPTAARQTNDAPVLSVDDGSYEAALGVVEQSSEPRFGNQAVFLNRFTIDDAMLPFSLDTVSVLFPVSDPIGATGLMAGQPFDILVYVDPTGSGDPANTTQVVQQRISLAPSNSVFQTVRLQSPVLVESGDIWVGFTNTVTAFDDAPIFPGAIDFDSVQGRSWAFFSDEPGAHFGGGPLASAELGGTVQGNWLIRASGQGGGLTAVCWDAPNPARGALAPPMNTRVCSTVPPFPDGDGLAEPRGTGVKGYNVYRSNEPGVAPTPGNLFTTTPPGQTSVNSSVSPGGSFFTVTALYDDGESEPSEELAVVPPTITNTKVKANKIRIDGSNFNASVQVLVGGVPFAAPPKVKKNGGRLVQKGPLANGQTVFDFIDSQGGQVQVVVRNPNGTFAAFDATR